jgi:peptidoglycan/LPS O-acetylase OafA/YrhL
MRGSGESTVLPTRIEALTGIRGLAALWVLLFHLRSTLHSWFPKDGYLDRLVGAGYLGVDLFFALSGFVICHVCAREIREHGRLNWGRFAFRRFARIYPLHLFTIVLLGVGVIISQRFGGGFAAGGTYDASGLVRHLSLTYVWIPGGSPSWNVPAWSIHAEWFAYMLFVPLAVWALKPRPSHGLGFTIVGLYAALILMVETLLGGNYDLTYDYGLLRIAVGFTAGCIIWRLWASFSFDWLRSQKWVGTFWLVTLAASIAAGTSHGVVLLLVVAALPLAVSTSGYLVKTLSCRPLCHLGEISYALYMTHGIVLSQLDSRVPISQLSTHLAGTVLTVLLYGSVLWVTAYLTWRWVEVPCRLWLLSRSPAMVAKAAR